MRNRERLNVWLDNVSLRDVDPRILIRAIREDEAEAETEYARNPGRPGRRLLDGQRTAKQVTIEFAIRELYDLAARTEILDAVNGWALGKTLTVSTRPARRLMVRCARYAAATNVREYTETYALTFEANAVPFWEDAEPVSVAYTGGNQASELLVRGDTPTVLEASFTPTAGNLSYVAITVSNADGTQYAMTVSTSGITAGKTVTFGLDERGYYQISGNGRFFHQQAANADELVLKPGKATVSVNVGSVTCDTALSARGRWL